MRTISSIRPFGIFISLVIFSGCVELAMAQETPLSKAGIYVIPYPKEVTLKADKFAPAKQVSIVLDKNASEAEKFSASILLEHLRDEYDIHAVINGPVATGKSIILTKAGADKKQGKEQYRLTVDAGKVTVRAAAQEGIFYGVQTLFQLIKKDSDGVYINALEINDWPDTKVRAVHYDTKHHQDTQAYVERFIRDLAKYKINMLVWEWEDKLAYPSHPEIGAPGAFTIEQMQEITRYAKKYNIQLTPLVQGLGHVSFILKWPQYAHLREVPASNFEFCPLKAESYDLLFDLWDDAIKATPGSEYIHIGSDETYELGMCPDCAKREKEIGRSGLYHLFTARATKHLAEKGRKVMAWERPMGWTMSDHQGAVATVPDKRLILTESYDYETPDFKYAKEAKSLGYSVYAYDPNPGVEPLFLPYFFRKPRDFATETIEGCLEHSYNYLTSHLGKGVFDGVIRTSWDDAGLHNQVWMLTFATAAAFSWNASLPSLDEFTATYFKNYYGEQAANMERLFFLLNDGALFYMESFERHVWHDKSIGKTRIPDMPRGDVMEYNPFWNKEYAAQVARSKDMLAKMDEAATICGRNISNGVKNKYDFEIFQTIIALIRHNAQTFLDLSALEKAIAEAHRQNILDKTQAYANLEKAESIVQSQLERRKKVFDELVSTWEKTRLPKGMSADGRDFFFEQDRTVHFANRAPDMSYLILDEERLDLEGYLTDLQAYMKYYRERFLTQR
jgi:hypothetical protein